MRTAASLFLPALFLAPWSHAPAAAQPADADQRERLEQAAADEAVRRLGEAVGSEVGSEVAGARWLDEGCVQVRATAEVDGRSFVAIGTAAAPGHVGHMVSGPAPATGSLLAEAHAAAVRRTLDALPAGVDRGRAEALVAASPVTRVRRLPDGVEVRLGVSARRLGEALGVEIGQADLTPVGEARLAQVPARPEVAEPEWLDERLTATATAGGEPLAAAAAARASARAELAERLLARPYGGTTLGDAAADDPRLAEAVRVCLDRVRVVKVRYLPAGARVEASLDPRRFWDALQPALRDG